LNSPFSYVQNHSQQHTEPWCYTVSTYYNGKYDKKVKGEKVGKRKNIGKKQNCENCNDCREYTGYNSSPTILREHLFETELQHLHHHRITTPTSHSKGCGSERSLDGY
jgi:catalase